VARKRPTASDVSLIPVTRDAFLGAGAALNRADALTLAQTRALRRCAPLSSAEFKSQRLVLAQQHRFSVLRILRHGGTPSRDARP